MNYENAINILTNENNFKIDLGLERIEKILELLGNPQDQLNCIHVAGTNGKGSVCAILHSILKEAGYKTGLYTSPHIFEYTERIKINENEITRNRLRREIWCNKRNQKKYLFNNNTYRLWPHR